MNMRERFKKLFTLAKKSHDGFTLVELIVVMAILAVLGGIGIPAYSAYVKEANITADETLAAEVEHALLLAHYEGTLAPGSSVIVAMDKDVQIKDGADSDSVDNAMQAAFGSNYKKDLRLSWDGWNTNVSDNVGSIENSTFNTDNIDVLLGDVATLSKAVQGFLGDNPSSDVIKLMSDYAKSIGIEDTSILSSNTALANLIPLMVSQNISAAQQNENFSEGYKNSYGSFEDFVQNNPDESAKNIASTTGMDYISALSIVYARMEGVVNYVAASSGDSQVTAQWTSLNKDIKDKNTAINTLTNMGNFLLTDTYSKYIYEYFGATINSDDTISQSSDAPIYTDGNAFLAYMNGVDNSISGITKDTSGLTDENYYTSDLITNLVSNYVVAGMLLKDEANAIAFIYNGNTIACYPLDYITY